MEETLTPLDHIRAEWHDLPHDVRLERFHALDRESAEDLFLSLNSTDQAELVTAMQPGQRRSWVRLLALDDTADLIQHLPHDLKDSCILLLDNDTRREVAGLLAYAEDDAGGLMNPRYIRLRADMEVEVALRYIRVYLRTHENSIYYGYVLQGEQLIGVVSFRQLLIAQPSSLLRDVMITDLTTILDTLDQEEVARIFSDSPYTALPVVDENGNMKGIVNHDDIAEAIEEEATEDIHKIGGMEALDLPYWKTSFITMVRKRAGWLTILFFGEMLTANALTRYQDAIANAVVLTLFIPLIISSGGNSGSQASTLVIRALALHEVTLRQWWRVLLRELGAGLSLGLILASVGAIRILYWPDHVEMFGVHSGNLALTVGVSLVGVVLWGATAGAMLPFALRRLNLDPASASAPLVATVVDVTGLMIYFNVARVLMF